MGSILHRPSWPSRRDRVRSAAQGVVKAVAWKRTIHATKQVEVAHWDAAKEYSHPQCMRWNQDDFYGRYRNYFGAERLSSPLANTTWMRLSSRTPLPSQLTTCLFFLATRLTLSVLCAVGVCLCVCMCVCLEGSCQRPSGCPLRCGMKLRFTPPPRACTAWLPQAPAPAGAAWDTLYR